MEHAVWSYIAYAYIARREVRSAPHATREAAAAELFARHARLRKVSTCTAHRGWPTGNHILTSERPAPHGGA